MREHISVVVHIVRSESIVLDACEVDLQVQITDRLHPRVMPTYYN